MSRRRLAVMLSGATALLGVVILSPPARATGPNCVGPAPVGSGIAVRACLSSGDLSGAAAVFTDGSVIDYSHSIRHFVGCSQTFAFTINGAPRETRTGGCVLQAAQRTQGKPAIGFGCFVGDRITFTISGTYRLAGSPRVIRSTRPVTTSITCSDA